MDSRTTSGRCPLRRFWRRSLGRADRGLRNRDRRRPSHLASRDGKGRRGNQAARLRLEIVEAGTDLDGEEQTSCVVKDAGDAPPQATRKKTDQAIVAGQLPQSYDRLADAAQTSGGFAGETVRKVPIDFVREDLRSRGILDTDDKDHLTSQSKMLFMRAKRELVASGVLVEKDKFIWRTRAP
jgi:hypothetical protein